MKKNPSRYSHLSLCANIEARAANFLVRSEQRRYYPNVVQYFSAPEKARKDLPNLVAQLNIFMDKDGLLRVGSKMNRSRFYDRYFPIFLPRESKLTELIILQTHSGLKHSGVYSVLTELRRQYWISKCFSTVKKILKCCIHCRRFNNRTLKLNQNAYRDFRLTPSNIPFSNIFIDHIGPFFVENSKVKTKVWILLITCLYTRSINLKLCIDLTTEEFLRAFQLHVFEYGLPSIVLSDLGSSLVSGADIITNFLKDPVTCTYFKENGSKCIEFNQYYKGCSKLGSLVESCVKLTKRLIAGSIGKNVLNFRDFEFVVMQTRHLVNRRPIAFVESLRDCTQNELPEPITPELLIHGHNLISTNIIPTLQGHPSDDPDWNIDPVQSVRDTYAKLKNVRSNLMSIYSNEYLGKLIDQATNEKDRYCKVTHDGIEVGDIVLLKEDFTKPIDYPMGRIQTVQVNSLGEVTGATVKKGKTNEIVKRHSSVLIPLLRMRECFATEGEVAKNFANNAHENAVATEKRPRRAAAVASESRTRTML